MEGEKKKKNGKQKLQHNFIRQPKAEGCAMYKKKNNKYNITEAKSIVENYLERGVTPLSGTY